MYMYDYRSNGCRVCFGSVLFDKGRVRQFDIDTASILRGPDVSGAWRRVCEK